MILSQNTGRFSVPIVAVCLVSCSPNVLTSTLEAITLSAEIAIPVVAATGTVDPATLKVIADYVSAVSEATRKAAVHLASGEPGPQQAAEIIADFQAIVVPVLGPNVPPRVVDVVNAVAVAVKVLLDHFTPERPAGIAASRVTIRPVMPPVKITRADRWKLSSIAKRSQVVSAQAKQLLAK